MLLKDNLIIVFIITIAFIYMYNKICKHRYHKIKMFTKTLANIIINVVKKNSTGPQNFSLWIDVIKSTYYYC